MIIIFFLALSLSTPAPSSLLNYISESANVLNQKCTLSLPNETEHRAELSSLLCGEKITHADLAEKLSKTSLIHLFIISGSHLILADQILSKMRFPSFLRFLLLTIYAMVAGWQPPVVRALLGIFARSSLRHYQVHFPGDLIVLCTGLLCLSLFPTWVDSLSLQLSWCAALALTTPSLFKVSDELSNICMSQFAILLFLSLPLWGFGSLHPLGLLYNIVFAPVIAMALLPLGVLACIIPLLLPLFDFFIDVFYWILKNASEPVTLPAGVPLSRTYIWLWIGVLHFILHFLRLHLRQGKDSSR